MQELQPPIYFFDIRIGEPITALTDVLVSAVCFYAFYKLKGDEISQTRNYFKYYFLFLGLATLWGGLITHAFMYALSLPWKIPGWIISTWAISLLAFTMVKYHQPLITKIFKTIIWIIIMELVLVMGVIIYTVDFTWAGAHSVFGLFLLVGSLSLFSYTRFKDRGSLWMLYGVGTFLISGIIFSAKLSIDTWFNHIDLAHVFMAMAVYFIFKGTDEMTDVEVSAATD